MKALNNTLYRIELSISVLVFALFATTARSGNFIVTTTDDGSLPAPVGSLRAAVHAANTSADPSSTISFSGVSGVIVLSAGELELQKNVTITGPGAKALAIDGFGSSRVFHVSPSVIASISTLTIQNGRAEGNPGLGGGILNEGSLWLDQCHIFNCSAA